MDLLVVDRLKWCLHPKLQKLLLEVSNHLCPLLELGTQRLVGMLKVDDTIGQDIHLLMSDVEQLMGVVPPMLGLTKMTVSELQLTVLLGRWNCSIVDSIVMP
jgi:hypothetical protein